MKICRRTVKTIWARSGWILSLVTASAVVPAYSDMGDRGPGGGIIFYESEDGLHGLEVAPSNVEGKFAWGCMNTSVAGVDDVLFDVLDSQSGEQNTLLIAAACGPDSAAAAADNYEFQGVDDWFLPNKEELDLIFHSVGQGCGSESTPISGCKNVAEFPEGWYWSSTEYKGGREAWNQEMWGGGFDHSPKKIKLKVRAIRVFKK